MADRLLVKKTNITNTTGAVCMDGVSGGPGTQFYIYKAQSLPANSTFIHGDKIVVDDTDEIWVKAGGTASIDVIVSYLQQDDA